MTLPRRARTMLRQRDMVLKAHAKGYVNEEEALEKLARLRWQRAGEAWSVRADLETPKLIRTDPHGVTQVMAETKSWMRTWGPVIPLVVLSVLALWGFATSTADPGRAQAAPGHSSVPVSPQP